jgi:prevent-host-death family protein
MRVNMHQAKSDLSKLVVQAHAGEEVIITRSGKPVARLIPFRQKRVPGSAKGLIRVSPEFYEPLPDDILDAFEGR